MQKHSSPVGTHEIYKLAFTVLEAQRAAGISRSALYQAISRGDLRAVKHGKRTLFLRDDLTAFLTSLPAMRAGATA